MYSGSIFSCKFNQIREKWSRGATNLEKLSSQFPSIGTITWRNCLIFWCCLRLLFVRVWSPTFYFHREERISRSFPSESSIHGEVDTMMRMNLLGGWLHFLFFLRHRLSRICWNIGIWTQPADKRWRPMVLGYNYRVFPSPNQRLSLSTCPVTTGDTVLPDRPNVSLMSLTKIVILLWMVAGPETPPSDTVN